MKRFAMALALACVLSGTALAGDIPSTDVKGPRPPGSSPVVAVLMAIINAVVS